MNLRPFLLVAGITIVGMLIASAVAWASIPSDAEIPIHWNISGEVDGTASKAVGLLMTPALAIGMTALLAAVPFLDPRREHMRQSMRTYTIVCSSVIVFIGLVHLAVVWAALGNQLDIARLIGIGAAAMFGVIGLVIGNTRSNWFLGVRTPWTLSSERSWERTHRLAGRLFLASAAIMLVAGVIGTPALVFTAVIGSVLLVTVIAVVYSYLVWRDDPDREGVHA